MENYLKILEDSLLKKSRILDEIAAYNEEQNKIFSSDKADIDKFDEYIDEKDRLIEKLIKLDDGFESLYARLAEQIKENKERYAGQIKNIQQLIREITDKSMKVQAQETRNKALIEEYFSRERQSIRNNRRTSKAAYDYYKSMSGANIAPPQFMDSKQ